MRVHCRFFARLGAQMNLYLAGFDVFRPDAVAYGERLKQLCQQHGFTGLFPLDNETPAGLEGPALAQWICQANLARIDQADLVMANVNPFRGMEPDSGTVFEMGYAHAKGKPVWAYTDMDESLIDQLGAEWDAPLSRHSDLQGYTVEDFNLPLNLMLACTARIVIGDAQACLQAIAQAHGKS